MIDGIKTGCLPLDVEKLSGTLGVALNQKTAYCNRDGLIFGFSEMVDTDTGEVRYMCGLRGSVHKYANRGTHNADDFRMSDLYCVFIRLRDEYGIKPDCTRLYSIEFGVNLKLPYNPQRIIRAARRYKASQFTPMGDIGIEHKADAFRLKIYDKGKQCGLSDYSNTLRVEIKAERNYLKRCGVHVPMLGDLLNLDVWERFENILLQAMGNITFYEPAPLHGLTKKESDLITLFSGDGWLKLDKYKCYRERKKFQTLSKRLNLGKMKADLKELITKKCAQLRDVNVENRYRDGMFPMCNNGVQTKEAYKRQYGEDMKTATGTAFFQAAQKDENRYRDGFKIKGVSVAKTQTEDASLTNCLRGIMCVVKKYDTITDETKNRGKPLNEIRINTS